MEHRMGTRRRRGLGEVQRIPLPGMRRLPGQKTRMVSDTFTCGVEHDISFLNVRSYEKKEHTCNPFTSTAVLILFPVPQDGKEHQQGRSLTGRQAACTGHDMLFRSRKKSPGRTVREWNILSPWPNVTALRVKR